MKKLFILFIMLLALTATINAQTVTDTLALQAATSTTKLWKEVARMQTEIDQLKASGSTGKQYTLTPMDSTQSDQYVKKSDLNKIKKAWFAEGHRVHFVSMKKSGVRYKDPNKKLIIEEVKEQQKLSNSVVAQTRNDVIDLQTLATSTDDSISLVIVNKIRAKLIKIESSRKTTNGSKGKVITLKPKF